MSDPAAAIPDAHDAATDGRCPVEDWVLEWQAAVERAMDRIRHPDDEWIGQYQAAVDRAMQRRLRDG
jgi:hypothetical protein